jgi:zinc D-Ala-D-Ala carboxypeptidase
VAEMTSTPAYQLRHFTEFELACRHCGRQGCTEELKQALDDYRDVVKLPVIVNDAYRCEEHNAAVSLVSKSQHPEGTAADIRVPGLTLQEMYDAALKIPAFKYGGIGVYDKNFIHVDVRHTGLARWAFVGNKEMSIAESGLVK